VIFFLNIPHFGAVAPRGPFDPVLNFEKGHVILAFVIGSLTDMLKTLRRGAIDNPWFFRIIMGIIAAAFVVTMGWGYGNFTSRSQNMVATVDTAEIETRDYQIALKTLIEGYRARVQDASKIDDKLFKQAAIDQLIARQIWLKAAREIRITVSDQELMDNIAKIPAFLTEGKDGQPGQFDLERYHRLLAGAHLTPEGFERAEREDLLIDKTKRLLQDSVQLTPPEIEEARKNSPQGQDPDRAVSDALYLKRQRALLAFSSNLKSRSKIVIRQELL